MSNGQELCFICICTLVSSSHIDNKIIEGELGIILDIS